MRYRLAILSSLLLFIGCSNPQQHTEAIEKAAQGYLDAMGNYLIDDAAPYATRQTREKTIPTLNEIMAKADTSYINSNRPATITIKGSRMLSDTSARVYYHKSTPIKEDDDSVRVVLEDGQWLVDVRLAPLPLINHNKNSQNFNVDPKKMEMLKKRIDKELADSKKKK